MAALEGEAVVGGPVYVCPWCIMVRVGARVGPGGLSSCGEWIRARGQLLVNAAHEFASLGRVRVAALVVIYCIMACVGIVGGVRVAVWVHWRARQWAPRS